MRAEADFQPHARLPPLTSIVHLVGPGGSGKTSAGPLLAQRLGWQFVDLDERFMSGEGSIGASIEASGYRGYAKRNIAVYRAVKHSLAGPTVLALSSGFLTYPEDVDAEYAALRRSIEDDALTALLLPAFELEACVEIIVRRQLSRPYLPGNRAIEQARSDGYGNGSRCSWRCRAPGFEVMRLQTKLRRKSNDSCAGVLHLEPAVARGRMRPKAEVRRAFPVFAFVALFGYNYTALRRRERVWLAGVRCATYEPRIPPNRSQ